MDSDLLKGYLKHVGKILCATRGGEASVRTQEAAISLAKERGDTLVFLYVVDLHFLDKIAVSAIVDVEKELSHMGEFLLLMAQERAEAQGISAEITCCEGRIRDQLIKAARELGVSLIVLGRPAGEESFFKLEELKSFAMHLEEATGVETRIA